MLSYRKWKKQGQGERRAFWFCGERRTESAVYIAEKLLEYIRQFGIRQKIGLFFVADDAEMQKKQGGLGKGLGSETLAKKKKYPCDTYSDIDLKTQESECLFLESILPLWCADVHLCSV